MIGQLVQKGMQQFPRIAVRMGRPKKDEQFLFLK